MVTPAVCVLPASSTYVNVLPPESINGNSPDVYPITLFPSNVTASVSPSNINVSPSATVPEYAIVRTVEKTGAEVSGPIPLPTRTQRWTVLKSPHVDKKSREQFELKTHKRLIEISDPRAQTVDSLAKLDLPAGVDVEIKVD